MDITLSPGFYREWKRTSGSPSKPRIYKIPQCGWVVIRGGEHGESMEALAFCKKLNSSAGK